MSISNIMNKYLNHSKKMMIAKSAFKDNLLHLLEEPSPDVASIVSTDRNLCGNSIG